MAGQQSRNGGGGKMVTFEEATIGRRHRNGSLSTYLDIGSRDVNATGRAGVTVRPLQPQGSAASRRRTYADDELDVFAAERYFKGGVVDSDHHHRRREDGVVVSPAPLETAVAVTKPVVGTRASAAASVSASSATSANSRTMLLRGGRGHRDDNRHNRCCGVQVSALLMRSCSGKRSVRVDSSSVVAAREELPGAGEPTAASRVDWYRELRMQKAALGVAVAGDGANNHRAVVAARPATPHLPPNLNLGAAKVAAIGREDKPDEFTTFSPSSTRRFTLVAPVRANNVPAANGDAAGGNEHGDDDDDDDGAGSESSSDLFEIKSLMIDDCPYEPSEASIQWSVATASAADAPERGDHRVSSARWKTDGGRGGGSVAGRLNRNPRPPAGLLSGCVSHGAVEVSSSVTTGMRNAPRWRREGFQESRNGGA